ncbi:basic-leucine zipper transcription factor A-like [Aphis craccivora]|uniref:Basic-leucine zipper transcription factor A-like n=1 Tax=Aphis craccivora TaxID=307492 RepID=A0A6G0YY33_APHCR|nr:basic-leucine zipper transcription factor A-like [Aphis craccivora]
MAKLNSMVIFCLVQLTLSEDRISVDTVGTITATAGYSIADNHSPTIKSHTSSIEFSGDHDSFKDTSSSSEAYTSLTPGLRSSQSLSLRSRQARGKPQSQTWSAEEKDLGNPSFSLTDHRMNEQLYNVKPQTFDNQSPQLSDVKSNESVEKSVPSITYGKKMHKNDGHDDRPVFNDWSEEVHMAFDNNKPIRSRRKNKHQLDSEQEKRKTQNKKLAESNNKDGWQELSPNMEIATGIITSVQEHDSSQESSGSSELFNAHRHSDLFHEDGISSAEDAAHRHAEPQNFDHKQVLSKMNHFDFSNAVSQQANKTPPPREKRLNYLQPGGGGPPAARYPYSAGGGPLAHPSPVQVVGPSPPQPHPAAAVTKSVKIEQPSATPNYHSIVVPIPISHQMYAAIGGDPSSPVHGHQLASSTVQQAMMSLPVVHNVFFKTDENGGGKTMPAIVIPLKPEYLHQLQQQHYAHAQQQQSAADDSLNAAGHQRPVHQGAGKALQFQQLQQQLQQQSSAPSSLAPLQPYAQKPKTVAKVKKPFGLQMKDNDMQHRVKQPFGLQHQFYSNPFAAGGGGGHVQLHHAGHQQQHGGGGGGGGGGQQSDDSRYAQSATAPDSVPLHAFPGTGHPIVVKRPHAYGYAASPTSTKYSQAVNKSPQLQQHHHNNHHHHHHNNLHHHHQQQQQQPSTEELAAAIAQQQLLQQQPFKATTYHPGYAYLNGPDDDYPYKPIYKDMNKRNDVLVVRTAEGRN